MIRAITVLLLAVVVAGCGKEDTAVSPPSASAPEVATPAADTLEAMIPGLDLGPSIRVQEERVYTVEPDEVRQGFSLVYTGMDQDAAVQRVQSAFADAGYVAKTQPEVDDAGAVKQNFMKEGMPAPFVAVYPQEQSEGKIWISWRVAEGNAQAP